MKTQKEIMDHPKVTVVSSGEDGGAGYVDVGHGLGRAPQVVWSFGGGWDHVSVSYPNRCPTWEEMCRVKDIFFREDECCIEYHPAKSEYVNLHPYCLHIWKPQDGTIVTPPTAFV